MGWFRSSWVTVATTAHRVGWPQTLGDRNPAASELPTSRHTAMCRTGLRTI